MRLFKLSKIFLYFTSKKKLKSVLSMTEIKRQRHRFPHLLEIRPDAPAPIRMYPRISSHNRNCHWHPGCILQKKPQVPNPTLLEAWHPIHNSSVKPSSMPKHKTRPDSPLQTPQKPWDCCQKWRGTLRFLPKLEMRPFSSLQWCERNPDLPLETWKQIWLPWGNMSWSPRPPTQLERNPKLLATTP